MVDEATAPAQLADRQTRSIGEVINALRSDFPDISVSKVRFLEAQGLISPTRSPSGYRMFADEDVDRLRYVLSEQRDHFLPLKVIKSKLTSWDRGEEMTTPARQRPRPRGVFRQRGDIHGR